MPHASNLTAAPQHPAPRFAAGWAALVYALATLSLAYPALAGGFLVNPRSDQFMAGYAFREFAAASLRSGQGFPQWNPYLFGGMPYIGGMHGDIFYPTFLLRMILPTDIAMTWGFIIHVFLAGLFTYFFLRALGVGFHGALIGGLAYCISGPIGGLVSPGHDGKLFISALLPLALWLLVSMIREGRHWAYGAFAGVIGLGVLTPHPQLLQYLLLASGAFALFIALAPDDAGRTLPRSVAIERLIFAFGAVLLGGLIGAVQFVPLLGTTYLKAIAALLAVFGLALAAHTAVFRRVLQDKQTLRFAVGGALLVVGIVVTQILPSVVAYEAWSPRAGGKDWAHAISFSLPTEELLNAFIPEFSGILDNYWGRNGIHFHSEYPGVVVLVLAGLGMFSGLPRRVRWFWIGVFVVSLLWALGGSTPFYRIVHALVPGTTSFRAPSTMMFLTMFSLAVFAAFGTERALSAAGTVKNRYLIGWAVAIVAIGLLAVPLAESIATSIGQMRAATTNSQQYVALYSELAANNAPAVVRGALRSIAFVLVTLGLLWTVSRNKVPVRLAAAALGALIVLDLWLVERQYWQFSRPASVIYATDPAIEAIRAAKAPGRVFAWDPIKAAGPGDPVFGRGNPPIGTSNGLMTRGVRSLTGYHGNELGRYQLRLEELLLDPQLWRHENVQYLYTTIPDSVMPTVAAQLKLPAAPTKILGPVKNVAGTTVYLYRLPGDNRMAWVASAMVKGTDDEAFATVLDPRFDPRRAAVIDTGAPITPAPVTAVPEPSAVQANVTRYEPGRINVELSAPIPTTGSVLVVSENYYPGWHADIGGQSAAVVRANYNLIGVPLPQGARTVSLTFRDAAYALGKVATLIALAVTIATIVAGVLMDRQRTLSAA